MAIGFPPKFTLQVPLDGLSQRDYLLLSLETFQSLNWEVGPITETVVAAYTTGKEAIDSQFFLVHAEEYSVTLVSRTQGFGFSDMGLNQKNMDSFLHRFVQVRAKSSQPDLDQRFTSYVSPKLENEVLQKKDEAVLRENSLSGLKRIFLPRQEYMVTPILFFLLLGIWLAQVFSGTPYLRPAPEDLIALGANYRPETISNEPWRLFTNIFSHKGLLGLVFALYALIHIGLMLEPVIGRYRFLFAFVFCGIVASVSGLIWNDFGVNLGCLGAISGLYGVFVSLVISRNINAETRQSLLAGLCILIMYSLYQVLIKQQSVDYAGNIGGFLFGLLLGAAMIPTVKTQCTGLVKGLVTVGFAVLTVLVSYLALTSPREIDAYWIKVGGFNRSEALAAEIDAYDSDRVNPTEMAKVFQISGIDTWSKCKRSLEQLKTKNLPFQTRNEVNLSIQYCELRLKSYRCKIYALSVPSVALGEKINEMENELYDLRSNILSLRPVPQPRGID